MTDTIHPFENMIVAISRLVKNGETAATGTLSPVPAAALCLAQMTHAPDMLPLIYGDPDLRITDGLHEFFGLAHRGLIDLFFVSGIQIDQSGNFNLSVIGNYDSPKVRLPGGAASNVMCMMAGRTIAFAVTHTPKLFVKQVDFVNANADDQSIPWRKGHLTHVVTPLAQMRYDREKARLLLDMTMPGVPRENVIENTGFDIAGQDNEAPAMQSPDSEEIKLLRGPVLDKLRVVYPNFANLIWGAA
jgi:glutaconate CoA-transferase subunit B